MRHSKQIHLFVSEILPEGTGVLYKILKRYEFNISEMTKIFNMDCNCYCFDIRNGNTWFWKKTFPLCFFKEKNSSIKSFKKNLQISFIEWLRCKSISQKIIFIVTETTTHSNQTHLFVSEILPEGTRVLYTILIKYEFNISILNRNLPITDCNCYCLDIPTGK